MHQLATEGAGFGPCGFGVPGKDDNNTKTYVYDIDHRSNRCIAVTKVMDLTGIPVALGISCPVGTGAKVISTTGGDMAGFDMYGQYITETISAAGTSVACYSSIAFGPADLLWTNAFGLPYKHASNNSPANITYIPPTGVNGRGSFSWSGTFPAEVMHDYTVDRDNMFGDVSADRPTPLAEVTMSGTVNNTGAIVITTTEVADGSSVLLFTFPADQGGSVEATNGAGTVNYQLSPLWMSKYGGNTWTAQLVDELVRGVSKNGTPIKVDLTGSPGTSGATGRQDPVKGPFMAFGTQFWVNEDTCMVGFDVDSDDNADTWYAWTEIDANDDISDQSKMAYKAQLDACGCST